MVLLDVVALQVLEQVHRPDAIGQEGLVGNVEELRQRGAQRGRRDLELGQQHFLDIDVLAARGARRQFEFLGRHHGIEDQAVVLRLDDMGERWRVREGDRQRLAQARDALLGDRR